MLRIRKLELSAHFDSPPATGLRCESLQRFEIGARCGLLCASTIVLICFVVDPLNGALLTGTSRTQNRLFIEIINNLLKLLLSYKDHCEHTTLRR